MKIIIENTYEALSETLGAMLLAEMLKNKRVNIDLTDGSSPKGAYEIVAKKIAEDPLRYTNVHYYNHDEAKGDFKMVDSILNEQIHRPFQVQETNIHRLEFEEPYKQIKAIEDAGGLDLMVLGLGADGHFCANFPDATQFDKLVYTFEPKKYDWYEAYCKNYGVDSLGELATFGFKMVLKTKRVVLVVNGLKKAQAVKDILTKPISTHIPGTILRCMDNLTLLLDKEAASLLSEEDIKGTSL